MKNIIRRVAIGIIIFAFLLPWLEIFFIPAGSSNLISIGIGVGGEINLLSSIIFVTISLIVFITALWGLFQPKTIPSIMILSTSALLLIVLYKIEEVKEVLQVLSIGNMGIFISFMLKNTPTINRDPISADATESVVSPHIQIPQRAEQITCTTCESTIAKDSPFCTNCGVSISN